MHEDYSQTISFAYFVPFGMFLKMADVLLSTLTSPEFGSSDWDVIWDMSVRKRSKLLPSLLFFFFFSWYKIKIVWSDKEECQSISGFELVMNVKNNKMQTYELKAYTMGMCAMQGVMKQVNAQSAHKSLRQYRVLYHGNIKYLYLIGWSKAIVKNVTTIRYPSMSVILFL